MNNTQQNGQLCNDTDVKGQQQHPIRNKWFSEAMNADWYNLLSLKRIEYSGRTQFQDMDIMELGCFGRSLVLDNRLQSCENDECVYHESLVHPVMLSAPTKPKSVFVGGGGEGATVREIFRHPSVETCTMVDIDGLCVEMCKKYLPNHHQGAYDDPRLNLVIDDAKAYLESSEDGSWDVIVLDLADPVDGGPCYQLYTDSFYEMCKRKLAPNGLLVTQSGPCGLLSARDVFTPIYHTVETVFGKGCAWAYSSNVPSFLEDYGFSLAINSEHGSDAQRAVERVLSDMSMIDERITERITGGHKTLKFYDGITHNRMFNLPKPIRLAMEREERVISKDNYVFMLDANTQSSNPILL